MKQYLLILCLLLVGILILLLGLTMLNEDEPQEQLVGEEWCEAMMDKPNQEWTDAETRSFSKTCLYN